MHTSERQFVTHSSRKKEVDCGVHRSRKLIVMASSKYDDTSGDADGHTMMMKILERLQDALYEETTVSLPTVDDEDSDDEQATPRNVATTSSGSKFREQVRAFESKNLIFLTSRRTLNILLRCHVYIRNSKT